MIGREGRSYEYFGGSAGTGNDRGTVFSRRKKRTSEGSLVHGFEYSARRLQDSLRPGGRLELDPKQIDLTSGSLPDNTRVKIRGLIKAKLPVTVEVRGFDFESEKVSVVLEGEQVAFPVDLKSILINNRSDSEEKVVES